MASTISNSRSPPSDITLYLDTAVLIRCWRDVVFVVKYIHIFMWDWGRFFPDFCQQFWYYTYKERRQRSDILIVKKKKTRNKIRLPFVPENSCNLPIAASEAAIRIWNKLNNWTSQIFVWRDKKMKWTIQWVYTYSSFDSPWKSNNYKK